MGFESCPLLLKIISLTQMYSISAVLWHSKITVDENMGSKNNNKKIIIMVPDPLRSTCGKNKI